MARTKFETSHIPEFINESLTRLEDALQENSFASFERNDLLAQLGMLYLAKFSAFGALVDLKEAVSTLQTVVAARERCLQTTVDCALVGLGVALTRQFESERGGSEGLDQAIGYLGSVAFGGCFSQRTLRTAFVQLSHALRLRYQETNKQDNLDDAVRYAAQAIDVCPTDHADLGGLLQNSAELLDAQFQGSANPDHLEQAIEQWRNLLHWQRESEQEGGESEVLWAFGNALENKVERGRDANMQNFDELVGLRQELVVLTPKAPPQPNKVAGDMGYPVSC